MAKIIVHTNIHVFTVQPNLNWEAIRDKITDRQNLLKILSYDKNWRLSEEILIKMYKTLVRSVLDYACVTSVAASNVVLKDFEVAQNDALRIIFKKSLLDKVKVEELRVTVNF